MQNEVPKSSNEGFQKETEVSGRQDGAKKSMFFKNQYVHTYPEVIKENFIIKKWSCQDWGDSDFPITSFRESRLIHVLDTHMLETISLIF